MSNSLKTRILSCDPQKWWGDDFDVRFYLITNVEKIKNGIILDVGGGIGIISSQLDKSNLRINLDSSINNLLTCKSKIDSDVKNICSSMTDLPFNDNSFDYVICSHLLEVAKTNDIENNNVKKINDVKQFPTVERVLSEMSRVLKSNGILFLTTPNNAYYKSTKLDYYELKNSLKNYFANYSLSFYNTFPRLSKKYRKLNLANVLPKIVSKVIKRENLLKSLIKNDEGKNRESVSFYVEATKS